MLEETVFLAGNMSSWLTMAISMPDLTRFAANQRSKIIGQLVLPFGYLSIGFLGVMGSVMGIHLANAVVIDPVLLTLITQSPILSTLLLLPLLIETFAVNTLVNLLPPGYDISNLYPKRITWFKGVMIAIIVGLAIGAWSFLGSAYGFMVNWLETYGVALGAIVAVNTADYAIVKRFNLDIDSLFMSNGKYRFLKGFNPLAFISFGVAIAIVYPPLLGWVDIPLLSALDPMASFIISFCLYLLLTRWLKSYSGI
ncbi:cytosine permease [Candidatus Acidianus copahuensis]|uniref:cytosine permease n=1 Tax=Candidatus Acidianus copahuensis TaxID=1160895 RepID=UPI0022846999|nr:cytosine permease [Candidatus Acidianus copahuensis]